MEHSDPLISAATDGDQEAVRRLYELHVETVYRFVRGMRVPGADVEDCVQDVFITAFRNLGRLRDGVKFSTWLYSIAVNVSRSRIRKIAWTDRLLELFGRQVDSSPEQPPDMAAERSIGREAVERILERLPEKKRAVLVMREIMDMDEEEIAEALQIPRGTVATRLLSARREFDRIARRRFGIEDESP